MVQFPRWQIVIVIVVLLGGLIFAAPNLFKEESLEDWPGWIPNQQVALGLDLQGGSYLLMQIQYDEVFEQQFEGLEDALRIGLRQAKIGYTGLGVEPGATVFKLTDPGQVEAARQIVRDAAPDTVIEVDDAGSFRIGFTEQSTAQRRTDIMQQTLEIVRRRVDELGTREASIQRQGDERVLVQAPGVDPERLKDIIGKTAKMTFRFVDEGADPYAARAPAGSEILDSNERDAQGNARRYVVKKRVMVDGVNLKQAAASFQDGQPVVAFTFDSLGAQRFAAATRDNVGRLFAIILDDEVISAPVIRQPILGGSGIISGSFTVQETQDLALLLRAGALPAELIVLEERTVGAGLGADSIAAGKIASILGLILVIVFMAAAYGLFGLMANVALIANLVLILGALSGLGATLTLPGIAGIVLTIGMAVDANVLIFERIREEAHAGRGPVSAIDSGYRRALTTILDSNLTTLIAALLLFQFGTGPVKGFAVTLAIGLVTSLFTAIMLTRLLVTTWLRRAKPQALAI